ncbi:DUF1642 domain-containing protein [Lacticaseibacillus paracasei]|uniref:DUF1642 domain-containing protein n=1 Tax=Lacticaseibacillus paracasei TaxID=1597 RepID=UPI0021C2B618|nr:DUF1642 domain-containing protein [Lacticaseibacillus paracasei]MCP9306142.1 DUF1642 domain-containing protein [Lacticaseibacillus paracasei]
MSEEKLYAVKNDEGEWADPGYTFGPGAWATSNKAEREAGAHAYGGHVVELIEKPNPEVVSKEEAKILDSAKTASYPANYISMHAHSDPGANGTSYDELRLMRALVNGYTVTEVKKYNVKVPHTDDSYFYKIDHETCNAADSFHIDLDRPEAKFTKLEIDHYHLQDYKKEEVTDDEQ